MNRLYHILEPVKTDPDDEIREAPDRMLINAFGVYQERRTRLEGNSENGYAGCRVLILAVFKECIVNSG